MATLWRFCRNSSQIFKNARQCRCQTSLTRQMASSGTGKEVSQSSNEPLIDKSEEFERLKEHFMDSDPTKLKNWATHGWSHVDREMDTFHHNLSMFALITVSLVFVSFLLYYYPDYLLRDWVHREAFLDLDRREKKGLPAIDPYFVPPETVILPSEEELGATEIII